ncbi:MAG: response regulator [Oscillospiraceae bacterium]|nr:response regulator [Oscillospiraceae bacterium]
MYILAVDDERIMLKELTTELGQVFPNECIQGFQEPDQALQWASQLAQEGQNLSYAFLDIRMRGMSGIELARRLKQLHPGTILIFCTAYTEYAFDAVGMYAKGYLMKPISAENIVRTLDEMVYDWRKTLDDGQQRFWIKTFGNFEVFVDGQPLVFEREKAKEMLAYLVDRSGASVTTEQLAVVLWEDRVYDKTLKNYVSTVLGSLRKTLRKVGKEDILIKTRNHLSVNPEKINCDAYDFEKGILSAVNSFRGEYMVNYSWAEYKTGTYVAMEKESI